MDGENHAKVVWRKDSLLLPFSTPSQTAWALDALISYYDTETPTIRKGISYLLSNPYVNERYPTGTGFTRWVLYSLS